VSFQGGGILLNKILQCVGQAHLLLPTSPKYRICRCVHVLVLEVILGNLALIYSSSLFIYRFITSVI
jgi:hypothetical protein